MKFVLNLFVAAAAVFCAGCLKKKTSATTAKTEKVDKKSKSVASISSSIPVMNYGEALFDDAGPVAFVDDMADQLDSSIDQARADMMGAEDLEQTPMKWEEAPQAFRTIHFDFDKANIRADQKDLLAADVEAARTAIEGGKNVVVQGHTDQIGSPVYNLALSEKRAKTVKNELVGHGLPANKIDVIGFGQEMPMIWSDAQSREELIVELAANRRAEFALS